MASWTLVNPLVELTEQMNSRFPKRDKASDGSIGDQAHASGASSHNPDKTGKPEYRDGDSKNELRAKDLDKDLRDPNCTMEQVVQEWVRLARAGKLWWVRYIIYNKRIWHRKDGFKTRAYTGKNTHTMHAHVNSEFTQKADEAKGVDWGVKNFRKTAPKPPAKPSGGGSAPLAPIKVDGKLGPQTVKRWQKLMKTTESGKLSVAFVKLVQSHLNRTVGARLLVDGKGIAQDGKRTKTTEALQRYLKSPVDGKMSKPDSLVVRALQRRLNTGRF